MSDKPLDGGDLLRYELARRDLSVRGLAKLLAGDEADHRAVERERRRLNRVLDGKRLNPENARRLADQLETDPTLFMEQQKNPTDLTLRRRLRALEVAVAAIQSSVVDIQADRERHGRDLVDTLAVFERRLDDLERDLRALRDRLPRTGTR